MKGMKFSYFPIYLFFYLLFYLFPACLMAQELYDQIVFPKDHGAHLTQPMEVWSFTGEFETEEGNKYVYIYQLKPHHHLN